MVAMGIENIKNFGHLSEFYVYVICQLVIGISVFCAGKYRLVFVVLSLVGISVLLIEGNERLGEVCSLPT